MSRHSESVPTCRSPPRHTAPLIDLPWTAWARCSEAAITCPRRFLAACTISSPSCPRVAPVERDPVPAAKELVSLAEAWVELAEKARKAGRS
jgi:hypothetical protein